MRALEQAAAIRRASKPNRAPGALYEIPQPMSRRAQRPMQMLINAEAVNQRCCALDPAGRALDPQTQTSS